MKHSKTWLIEIKTVSEANNKEHWSKSRKRHKMQGTIVFYSMLTNAKDIKPPVHIKLSRCEPRLLDDDNLPMSMKWITDAIASFFYPGLAAGRADSQKGIKFEYDQIKTLEAEDKGVLITLQWDDPSPIKIDMTFR